MILVVILSKDIGAVRSFIASSGWVGMLASVGLYGILGASPVPSEPLTLVLSASFGPFNAMLVAGFGNTLSAMIEYFIGTKIGDVADFEQRKEHLPFGLGRFPVSSPAFLIGARMLPGYGPKFVSVVAGMYKVKTWTYLWTSAVSTFLGAAIFAYGGFGLINLWK